MCVYMCTCRPEDSLVSVAWGSWAPMVQVMGSLRRHFDVIPWYFLKLPRPRRIMAERVSVEGCDVVHHALTIIICLQSFFHRLLSRDWVSVFICLIPWVLLYVHYTLSFLSLPSCSLFCPLPPSLPFAFPLIISPSQYQLPYVVSSQQYVINWCQMLHPLWRAGVQCWRGKSICATMGRWSFIDQP